MDSYFYILLGEIGFLGSLVAPLVAGNRLLRRGQYAPALKWFLLCRRLGRIMPRRRSMLALKLCACYIGLGDFDAALTYAEEAVCEVEKRNHGQGVRSLATAYLGIVLTRLGQFDRADALLTSALATPRLRPRLREMVSLCAASVQINRGRFAEATVLLETTLATARENGDNRAAAEYSLSLCRYYEGDLAGALPLARSACERPNTQVWLQTVALSCCLTYLSEMGETGQAQEVAARLMPLLPAAPPHVRASGLRAIAQQALQIGDLDRARSYAEQAYPLDPNPNAHAGALLIQAEVFAARQNRNRAEALCEEILRLPAIEFYKRRARSLAQNGQTATDASIARRYAPASESESIQTAPVYAPSGTVNAEE